MTQLESYASALLSLATVQGVSSTNPMLYKVVTGSDKSIIVSYAEPVGLTLPLNVLWLIADPASSSYQKILRRTSKLTTAPYTYSWSLVTDYDDAMTTAQYFDSSDTPEPVVISLSGGQLTGALKPRTASPYLATEIIPASDVDRRVGLAKTMLLGMYNNLNTREVYDDKRIRNLSLSVANLQSSAAYIHVQDASSADWVISHGLNTTTPEVAIWINGELVQADTVSTVDANTLAIYFSVAVAGSVSVRA
jgi:hypothetical protein